MDELKQQIKDFLLQGKRGSRQSYIQRNYPEFYKQVTSLTSFLQSNVPLISRYYCIIHNIKKIPVCKICQSPTEWNRVFSKGFKTYCSGSCRNKDKDFQNKVKKGILNKFGVENVSNVPQIVEKRKKTLNGFSSQKRESIIQKARETNKKRYGVSHPLKLHEFQERVKKTNLEKYGVPYLAQNENIKRKIQQNSIEKWGVKHYNQRHIVPEILKKLEDRDWLYQQHFIEKKSLLQISKELNFNNDMTTVARYLHIHGLETQHHYQSSGEKEVGDYIRSLGLNVETNNREIITPHELDIYIPSQKVALEYCGLYWHSEKAGKGKDYHINKYKRCNAKGIRLITLYEDEWLYKSDIVKLKLSTILGKNNNPTIYARNTEYVEVLNSSKKLFFEKHHIQGSGPGSITYGLKHNNELVSCITFINKGNGRFILNRYSSSSLVVGGFSKLLKHFQKQHHWEQIVTFADLRWSNGNLYEQTGWSLDLVLPPDYYYVYNSRRVHKFNFRKKYLPIRLKDYDLSKSEKENCDNNNILRIWDCGKLRFIVNCH